MNAFGKAKGGGRRAAARFQAPVLAVLATVTEDHRVAIVNLSGTGARLSGPDLPAEGEDVIFRAEGLQTFGQVIWSRSTQCGVAFESPVTAEEVLRVRREAGVATVPGLSAHERAAAVESEIGTAR